LIETKAAFGRIEWEIFAAYVERRIRTQAGFEPFGFGHGNALFGGDEQGRLAARLFDGGGERQARGHDGLRLHVGNVRQQPTTENSNEESANE
jgi:hypothetical protein